MPWSGSKRRNSAAKPPARSLSEALSGIPVTTVVRDEQRGQLFSSPLLRPEWSCPFHRAGKKKAGLVPLSSVEDVHSTGPHLLPPLLSPLERRFVAPPPVLGSPATFQADFVGPAFRRVCLLAAHGCAYEPSEKHRPMHSP